VTEVQAGREPQRRRARAHGRTSRVHQPRSAFYAAGVVENRDWRACAIEQRRSRASWACMGDWAKKGKCAWPSPGGVCLPLCMRPLPSFPTDTRHHSHIAHVSRSHSRGEVRQDSICQALQRRSLAGRKECATQSSTHHHRSKYASLHHE
jgi:hypothetical protein